MITYIIVVELAAGAIALSDVGYGVPPFRAELYMDGDIPIAARICADFDGLVFPYRFFSRHAAR